MNPRSSLIPLVAMAALFLAACEPGEKLAGGTGTTAGNTITARVLMGTILTIDGKPAVRTKVKLRPTAYLPWYLEDEEPPQTLEATTDSGGRFEIVADSGTVYKLECVRGNRTTHQVQWVDGIRFSPGELKKDLGAVSLSHASELTGAVVGASAGAGIDPREDSWIGFPGTENFRRLGPDGFFELKNIPPGARSLEILRRLDGVLLQRMVVTGWRVFAGNQAVLDTVSLPELAGKESPVPEPVQVSTPACADAAAVLVRSEYDGPTGGGESRVLRALLASDPPRWIELDPCLGIWRTLNLLPPETVKMSGTFSTADADFLVVGTLHRVLKIGRDGRMDWIVTPSSLKLVTAEYFGGRFYAMHSGADKLMVYPDEAALWSGKPADSVALGFPTSSLSGIAIEDGTAYFGMAADSLRLLDFDIHSENGAKSFLKRSGARLVGIATSARGGLWLLSGRSELDAFDPNALSVGSVRGAIRRRFRVEADFPIRGLTRYRAEAAGGKRNLKQPAFNP